MSNYNGLERAIARFLARFPLLKKSAKTLYSRLVFMRSKRKFKQYSLTQPVAFTSENQSSFFGYYDKSPLSPTGEYLLYQQSTVTKQAPAISSAQLICENNTKEILYNADIKAFNWQQGCKLQWLSNTTFIYNDFDETSNSYISKMIDVLDSSCERIFPLPIYDSFKDEFALCLNYDRLSKFSPDYGYFSKPLDESLLDLKGDGIWLMNLKTGSTELLLSLAFISELASEDYNISTSEDVDHTVNHIMISPDGNGFIFIHRYFINGRRFDRLIHSDMNAKMTVIASNEMVSHCFWVDKYMILGYLRGPDSRDGYWLIDINTCSFKPFAHDKLDQYGDGHPNVKGDWFVTDTYPDKARMQHLLLCNLKTEEVFELGQFFHGFQYKGETRCDLHPRFSFDGKSIFFDSVFTGERHLYQMDIKQ
jgi:hypothetical protein